MNTFFRRAVIIFLSIFITLYLVGYENSTARNEVSTVTFLDVGQGDSIFIESPSGKQLLVDAGRGSDASEILSEIMPLFDTSIDLVIGTHPDADHIGGMSDVLDIFEIGGFVEPGSTSTSKVYQSLEQSISQKKIPHMYARENMVVDFGDGAYFVVLFPGMDVSDWETNNSSVVGMYIYKNTSFLLTGDAPIATEMYLSKKYKSQLKTDVLKLGHHGSRTSSSETFLTTTNPGLAIISAGKNNSYGHPHTEVMDRLKKLEIPYFSTIDMGSITLETNGETIGLRR
ncbi:MAG: MBL fold metallo-hydrolase [Candidatus Pacebacteria bacterium]|nr:MBL fold metallo-hydrolase [Candidatus Paceibacterota bacterium]MBP9780814.1 MBL fold metallo-hydrolase [Candidatus Paceibacterota bacterium]